LFARLTRSVRNAKQSHQVFAVVDRSGGFMDIEVCIGFGLTDVSDGLTLKLILSRDLN